jgi:hypothetical protein
MQWHSKPIPPANTWTDWYRWFAWRPVRVPWDPLLPGRWVWLEVVYRRDMCCYYSAAPSSVFTVHRYRRLCDPPDDDHTSDHSKG